MKKVLSAIAVSGLILAGTSAFAADGVYVKGILKYVAPSDPEIEFVKLDNDNGYGWGGAVGYAVKQFRIEGEITTQKTDIDAIGISGTNAGVAYGSGDVRMTTYMVNGYFDIPVSNGFGFYLTGGLGYGTASITTSNLVDGDDSGFAWKGGAGMFYNFNDNMAVDLGWEYVSMSDADLDVDVTDLYTNNIVATFRYKF